MGIINALKGLFGFIILSMGLIFFVRIVDMLLSEYSLDALLLILVKSLIGLMLLPLAGLVVVVGLLDRKSVV